ncbi:MAG: 4-hydroxythreonine-4-phosphate dehydrogenase, partial [Pseudomonadota bacterium]
MILDPVALSSGEPSGIGPELAASAWHALREELVFFWIGDPSHLPDNIAIAEIETPAEARSAMANALPVLVRPFEGSLCPGTPNPKHAAKVI